MEKRVSIYVGAPLAALLDGHENRSGRLNGVAERYGRIIGDELGRLDFSRAEWCAIMDANNGAHMDFAGDTISWRSMWANVADSPELADKWGVDVDGVAARLRRLTSAAQAAVYEAVGLFWTHSDKPTDEALRLACVMTEPPAPPP